MIQKSLLITKVNQQEIADQRRKIPQRLYAEKPFNITYTMFCRIAGSVLLATTKLIFLDSKYRYLKHEKTK